MTLQNPSNVIGPAYSFAYGINNAGHVVGGEGQNFPNAFYFDGSQMHDLGTLGGYGSVAIAINNQDQIVGRSDTAPPGPNFGDRHAFLSTGGGPLLDLNGLIPPGSGWVLEAATGINDFGVIVGYGVHDGQERAFELTPIPQPVPEPTPLAFAGVCALAAGVWRLVRRVRRETTPRR